MCFMYYYSFFKLLLVCGVACLFEIGAYDDNLPLRTQAQIHPHTRSLAHTLTHTLTHAHAHAHTQTENGEYDGDARAKHIAVQRVCGEFYEYLLPFSVFVVSSMSTYCRSACLWWRIWALVQ